MATFLDVGLFQYFSSIFSVILIFAILFAVLHKTKILGNNLAINSMISISVALLSLLSSTVTDLINFMAPWFVLAFIFLILLLLLYQLLGATEKDIFSALKGEKTIQWAIFGVAIVIILAGFGHVWGQKLLTQAPLDDGVEPSDFEKNLYDVLFDPKIIGLVTIFLVAIFSVAFLASGD